MTVPLNDTNDGARCSRCGTSILRRTVIRYGGKCVPCSRKRWYDPLLDAVWFVSMLACAPYFLLRLGIGFAYHRVAKLIPGTRDNIQLKLESGWSPDWSTVRRIWSSAKEVYVGPIGPGAEVKVEYLLVKAAAENREIATSHFHNEIIANNPILAAYCIEALVIRGEHMALQSISEDVLQSEKRFPFRAGCFGTECTLGEFAQPRCGARKSIDKSIKSDNLIL